MRLNNQAQYTIWLSHTSSCGHRDQFLGHRSLPLDAAPARSRGRHSRVDLHRVSHAPQQRSERLATHPYNIPDDYFEILVAGGTCHRCQEASTPQPPKFRIADLFLGPRSGRGKNTQAYASAFNGSHLLDASDGSAHTYNNIC